MHGRFFYWNQEHAAANVNKELPACPTVVFHGLSGLVDILILDEASAITGVHDKMLDGTARSEHLAHLVHSGLHTHVRVSFQNAETCLLLQRRVRYSREFMYILQLVLQVTANR
jgi:hypothetical protein